jgi:hypothetical protein
MENEMKNLGCMNGWKSEPVEYTKCKSGCHHEFVSTRKLGNCWYEYSCEICKIKYNVDSSD